MSAVLVAGLLLAMLTWLVAVLVLPGGVKDGLGGPFLGVVGALALVLGVGLFEGLYPRERD